MKKTISLLLLFATLLGCCSGIIACTGGKNPGSTLPTVEEKKLEYKSDAIADFNQASVITGSGLTVTTDNVKTATNGGVWNTASENTISIPFSKTDLSSYKEVSVWINNTSDEKVTLQFSLISDDKSTDAIDSYGARINVFPGWHQYILPFSEMKKDYKMPLSDDTYQFSGLTPSVVTNTGTPNGITNITSLDIENLTSEKIELVIDSVYAKTQKYGTLFGQDYTGKSITKPGTKYSVSCPDLGGAVCFYEDSGAYLYDQLRYVLKEGDDNIAVTGDDDTIYVPIAVLAEHRGATDIVSTAEKVSFKYKGEAYEFTTGKAVEYVGVEGGRQPGRSLSSKPITTGDYLLVPMEVCAEIFDYVLYYDITGLVIFSDTKNIFGKSDVESEFLSIYELIEIIAFANYSGEELLDNMDELYPEDGHTRVIMNDADFARLKNLLETDPTYANWFKQFEAEYAVGSTNYNKNTFKYNLEDGYRLLMVSRDVMGLLIPYAFLYKMTDNTDYAKKCYRIMEQTTRFVDKEVTGSPSWHPEHFLDTGELMYGYSIAYDWCYAAFTEDERARLEDGILELGYGAALGFGELYEFWAQYKSDPDFQQSFKDTWLETYQTPFDKNQINQAPYQIKVDNEWLDSKLFKFDRMNWTNNWNGVCNGGMVTMALAFANVNEEFREMSEYLLECCMYTIPISLAESYGPDGGYPESPGYWSYGTTYSINFMQGLDSACGTNLGYIDTPGFSESFYFMNYISSPANGVWSYHDTGEGMPDMSRFFWFAEAGNDPNIGGLCYNSILNSSSSISVWALMWYNPENINTDITLSLDQCYYGIDTATFRSDWSNTAMYAGLHGSDNHATHGNLDIGNFTLEMGGVRFFVDLGSEEYNLKNDKYAPGVLFFSEPYRYWFYRERAEGQNTLVINPEKVDISNKDTAGQGKNFDQDLYAVSQIQAFASGETSAYAVVDMGCAYPHDANSGVRGMYVTDNRSTVVIQDEMTLKKSKNEVYWMGHLINESKVELSDDYKTAIVTYKGLSMVCSIVVPEGYTGDFKFQVMSSDYLQVTGLTSASGEYSRSGMQKLVAYSSNCPKDLKLAVVCRLLNDGPHSYTWTDIKDWSID